MRKRRLTRPDSLDPYEHAEQLGLTVIHRPIKTATGLWIPDFDLIVIRSGMRRVHDRSTLAHEIAHAILGHSDTNPKHEAQADRLAALNLIDPQVWEKAATCYEHIEQVAAECDVSTKLARAYAGSGGIRVLPSRPAA